MIEQLSITDTRVRVPSALDERETLVAFLDRYRETVLVKLAGLDRRQLTCRLLQSRTTLLGLVKHLLVNEQWWFATVMGGEPAPYDDPTDPDVEWLITEQDRPEQIVADYRAAYAQSNKIVRAAAALDVPVPRDTNEPMRYRPDTTVRWVLVHMLEETARHAGHADIVRELIDGRTGH